MLVLYGLVPLSGLRAQNLIQNGAFTANAPAFVTWPGYVGYSNNPVAITNWSFALTGNYGINGAAVGGFAAGQPCGPLDTYGNPFGPTNNDGGNTFAFIQGGVGCLVQPLPLGVFTPGATYSLSFDVAAAFGNPRVPFRLQIGDATQTHFTTQTGGVDLSGSTATFTHYSYTFTALPTFNGTPSIQLYNLTNSADAIDFANVVLSPSGSILFPAPGQAVPMDQASPLPLSWVQISTATAYDIYLGTSSNAVAAATTNTPGIYLGRNGGLTLNVSSLQPNTTYYWRADGVAGSGAISPGGVLSFTTGSISVDLMEDTWVATDALQRSLPLNADCGSPRTNRPIVMLYSLWHSEFTGSSINYGWPGYGDLGTNWDVTQYLSAHPYTNPHNPWADNPPFQQAASGAAWWSQQPELGYFNPCDPWALRRQLAQLSHAGVDVLMFDYSNEITFDTQLYALCDMIEQMRMEGFPLKFKITFLTHTYSGATITYLYNTLYRPGKYSDLWFYWQGKPLMLGYVNGSGGGDTVPSAAVQNFFTWRTSWANDTNLLDDWQYINSVTPQKFGYDTRQDLPEQVVVGAAGWANGNSGRSYTNHTQPAYNNYHLPVSGTQGQGLYFAEEMHYGLKYDPQVLLLNDWNEWVAGAFKSPTACLSHLLADCAPANDFYFVDDYNEEYSRDIAPTKGGHTDNYYMQMIGQNRSRKGARPVPVASVPQTINLAGDFSQWASVSPAYYDPVNDTIWRNYPSSVTQVGIYTNTSGRNDFTVMKVARDANNLYFMAQCKSNITSYTGSNWMVLFIDADQKHTTGWEGYDYAVNLGGATAATTTLSQNTSINDSWNWSTVRSDIAYTVSGKQLMLAIPRVALGLTNEPVTFDFHWADNFQTNDIADFDVDGDSAPDGRFNYRYQAQMSQMNVLLQDGFENGAQTEQTIWGNSFAAGSIWGFTASLPYDGNVCALANTGNGTTGKSLSASLNTANYSSMRITFYYKLNNVVAGDNVAVNYQGANGSVTITNLGMDFYYPAGQAWGYNERSNVWLHYTDVRYNTGNNTQFFTPNFTFSIVAPFTSSRKSVWIDDVMVTGVTNSFTLPLILAGTRAYDGTNDAPAAILTITDNYYGTNLTLSGSATLAGASPGTHTITSFTGLALGGTAASNYTLSGATGSVLITWATPVFTNLTPSQSIPYSTSAITLGGQLVAAGAAGPLYPALGELVSVTISGSALRVWTTITDSTGDFSLSYPCSSIPPSGTPYIITYSYGGDALFNAVSNTTTALTVNPLTPVFTGLTPSQSIPYGTAAITLGGQVVAAVAGGPVYPGLGEMISVNVSGKPGLAWTQIIDSTGDFSLGYPSSGLLASGAAYTITYGFRGDALFNAASNTTTTLTVNPLAVALAGTRAYDGTNDAPAAILTITNNLDGTNLTLSGRATLAGASVGPQDITSFSGLALGGTAASNYTLTGASGSVTITAATSVFSGLTPSQAITYGTTAVTLGGKLVTVGDAGPLYPAKGETITVTINGNGQTTTISDSTGDFSLSYPSATIPASGTAYTITYSYAGDASFNSASNTSTTLTVNPLAVLLAGTRPYDGTNDASATILTITDNLDGTNLTLSGNATLASAEIGTNAITSVGALTLGGPATNNYTLTGASGSVTVTPLAVILAGTRPYDGTNDAACGILSVVNAINGDLVNVASGVGTLASASVGLEAITSPGSLALGGTAASNYTLTGASGSVTITNPFNPFSVTSSFLDVTGTNVVVCWQSVPGVVYTVLTNGSLTPLQSWMAASGPISATSTVTCFTLPGADAATPAAFVVIRQ